MWFTFLVFITYPPPPPTKKSEINKHKGENEIYKWGRGSEAFRRPNRTNRRIK